jgi:hypothetical protein
MRRLIANASIVWLTPTLALAQVCPPPERTIEESVAALKPGGGKDAAAIAAGSTQQGESLSVGCLRNFALKKTLRRREANTTGCDAQLADWGLEPPDSALGLRELDVVVAGNVTRLVVEDAEIGDEIVYVAPAGLRAERRLLLSVAPGTKRLRFTVDCGAEQTVAIDEGAPLVRLGADYQPASDFKGEPISINDQVVASWPISLHLPPGAATTYQAKLDNKPHCTVNLAQAGDFDFGKDCRGTKTEPDNPNPNPQAEPSRAAVGLRAGVDLAWGSSFVVSDVSVAGGLHYRADRWFQPYAEVGGLTTGSRFGFLMSAGVAMDMTDHLEAGVMLQYSRVKIEPPTASPLWVGAFQPAVRLRGHTDWFGAYAALGYTLVHGDVSSELVDKSYVALGVGVDLRFSL